MASKSSGGSKSSPGGKDSKSSTSSKSSTAGNYSGLGGMDSPSERNGRGTAGSSASSSSGSKSTSTSSKGSSPSAGASASVSLGGARSTTSTSKSAATAGAGVGAGASASIGANRMGTGRPSSQVSATATGKAYSGLGGLDSPSEKTGRVGVSAKAAPSVGTGFAQAYKDMADSAIGAGISSLDGKSFAKAPTAREAEISSMNKYNAYQNALSTVRQAEANPSSPYTSVSYASPYGKPSNPDLTQMTIGEVLSWQEQMDNSAGKTYKADKTYVGAYQIGKNTLKDAVARTGLSLNTKFSKATQDYLGMDLMDNRAAQVGAATGNVDPNRFANSLSKEWAGLANEDGRSYYAGISGNKANVSREKTLDAATGLVESGIYSDRAGLPSTSKNVTRNAEPAATVDASKPAPKSFRDKYLDTPSTGPVPGAKPEKELSTAQKIAAGAIDVGVGLVPGFGQYAGLVNAGLQLTGNKTIGQQLVGSFADGSGGGASVSRSDQGGTRNTLETKADEKAATDAKAAAEATTVKPAERFVSTYLRPTPREKWSRV